MQSPQFFLGGAGTGEPWRYGIDSYSALAFGRKRWFLTRPRDAVFSVQTPMEWFKYYNASLNSTKEEMNRKIHNHTNIFQCTQDKGDVIYIPALYGHSSLNVQTSIGIISEFHIT